MKKILLSLMIISGIAAAMVLGTRAFFSDTESNPNNVIQAGTIDISVNDQNPWTNGGEPLIKAVGIDDLKPGMQKEITFKVNNVGDNDLVLWKMVKVTNRDGGISTEPEREVGGDVINDIDSQIHYDMTVGGVNIIPMTWDVMMSDVADIWIPMGKLIPGGEINVSQIYKLDENTGNAYQGDTVTFDIVLYAEQLNAPGPAPTTRGVVLENKNEADNFVPVMDNVWGILTWDASGNYKVRAWNLGGTQYQLQAWDYETDSNIGYFGSILGGGNIVANGTYGSFSTSTVKYWLRETATWNNALSLWESNLVGL